MDLKLEKWEITEIALNQIWEIDSGKWSSSNLETYDNSCFLEKQTRENFVVKWCLACIDSLNRESKQKAHLNRPLVSLFKIPKAKWDGGDCARSHKWIVSLKLLSALPSRQLAAPSPPCWTRVLHGVRMGGRSQQLCAWRQTPWRGSDMLL